MQLYAYNRRCPIVTITIQKWEEEQIEIKGNFANQKKAVWQRWHKAKGNPGKLH